MSMSARPTFFPCAASAQARLTATVDLPTPPLQLATAMTREIPSMRVCRAGPGAGPCPGFISGMAGLTLRGDRQLDGDSPGDLVEGTAHFAAGIRSRYRAPRVGGLADPAHQRD